MFIEKHLKKIIIGLIALCALLAGALIYREIDARRVPPLALESEIETSVSPKPGEVTATTQSTYTPIPLSTTPPQTSTATPTNTVTPKPTTETNDIPTDSSLATPKPGDYGTLTIRKKTFALKRGIDEQTLAKDIGWMESSASPGSDGVCVIMGHRNTQFRILKDVEKGDAIVITDATGATYTYIVQTARIIKKDSELRFEAGEGKILVLVTCYPFYFQGHAPHKYVVYARIVN